MENYGILDALKIARPITRVLGDIKGAYSQVVKLQFDTVIQVSPGQHSH